MTHMMSLAIPRASKFGKNETIQELWLITRQQTGVNNPAELKPPC